MKATTTENKNKEEVEEIKNVPYPLPEGWKWVRLGDFIDLKYGKSLKKEERKDGEIPVYGSNGIIGYHNVPLVNFPTLIIGRKGSVGEVNFALENSWVIDTAFYVVLKSEHIYLYYLFYLLSYFKNKLISSIGVKPGINRNVYLSNLIPLPFKNGKPDLEKQKQIVERIETIFKEVDKAITLRQKALEDTKKLFKSVLNKIFKEAEEDKENWKWVRLGEVVSTIKGKKPKKLMKENLDNYLPYLTADYFREKTLKQFSLPDKNLKLIERNDLVMIWDGSKSGDVFISDIKGILASTMVKLILKQETLFYRYLFYILKIYFEELNNNTTGSGIPHVSKDVFNNLMIPLPLKNNQPDLEKQKEIAEYLDNLHNKIKQLEELQQIQVEKFKQLKESILNKAFRGEMV